MILVVSNCRVLCHWVMCRLGGSAVGLPSDVSPDQTGESGCGSERSALLEPEAGSGFGSYLVVMGTSQLDLEQGLTVGVACYPALDPIPGPALREIAGV